MALWNPVINKDTLCLCLQIYDYNVNLEFELCACGSFALICILLLKTTLLERPQKILLEKLLHHDCIQKVLDQVEMLFISY